MTKSICDVLLNFLPSDSEVDDLYSAYIANCVINCFLAYTAIMLNIVTIHTLRKTSSLSKPLRTLLLSLAVSDVGVGLLDGPLYILLIGKWLHLRIHDCIIYKAFVLVTNFLFGASFFGIVAISVDRFLAIHLHLRYQELVTHKRVVAMVISIWVLSAFLSLVLFWLPSDLRSMFLSAGGVVFLFVTTIVYLRIFLAVQNHKNQIQALQIQEVQQVAQNGNMANRAMFVSLRKSAVGVFYVYVVFLICYLPRFIFLATRTIQEPSVALKGFLHFSWTLLFLNSSLNPLIYCWKMGHIRHAFMEILRNMIGRYKNCQAH
ncbi:adenosine receptor A2a-like [Oculina patagonica]